MNNPPPNPHIRPLSMKQACAQLSYVHPILAKRYWPEIEQGLLATRFHEPAGIELFRTLHPRRNNALVFTSPDGRHSVIVRDMRHGEATVHWIDAPRLVRKYSPYVDPQVALEAA